MVPPLSGSAKTKFGAFFFWWFPQPSLASFRAYLGAPTVTPRQQPQFAAVPQQRPIFHYHPRILCDRYNHVGRSTVGHRPGAPTAQGCAALRSVVGTASCRFAHMASPSRAAPPPPPISPLSLALLSLPLSLLSIVRTHIDARANSPTAATEH